MGAGSDQATSAASTAIRARHQLSAQTATAPSSRCSEWTPGIAFTAASLATESGFVPRKGAWTTAANSIPGSDRSMAYRAVPVDLARMSRRGVSLPIQRKVAGSRSGTSRSGSSAMASPASSP